MLESGKNKHNGTEDSTVANARAQMVKAQKETEKKRTHIDRTK